MYRREGEKSRVKKSGCSGQINTCASNTNKMILASDLLCWRRTHLWRWAWSRRGCGREREVERAQESSARWVISRAGTHLLITLSLYMQKRAGPRMEEASEMCRREVRKKASKTHKPCSAPRRYYCVVGNLRNKRGFKYTTQQIHLFCIVLFFFCYLTFWCYSFICTRWDQWVESSLNKALWSWEELQLSSNFSTDIIKGLISADFYFTIQNNVPMTMIQT